MPPAPGECVGVVEVRVVNDRPSPVELGRLALLLPGEQSDVEPPMGPPGPAFALFEPTWTGQPRLDVGEARVLTKTVVRTLSEPSSPFAASARVPMFEADGARSEWKSPTVPFDPAAWPVAVPLTPEAIDRAVAAGRGVRVVFYEIVEPAGGVRMLDILTDGVMCALAVGRFGAPDGGPLVGAGKMDDVKRSALIAAVRDAPLGAFRSDPKWARYADGHRVRLLVAAGPSACVLSSMDDDFRAAGLEPLLDRLRALIVELPRK